MTTVSLDVIEQRIRAYWSSPVGSVLTEAAAFARIRADILHDLSWQNWRPLYDRLRGEATGEAAEVQIGDKPILCLLWDIIDRRNRLSIRSPVPDKEQTYVQSARRSGGRGVDRGHGKNEMGKAS